MDEHVAATCICNPRGRASERVSKRPAISTHELFNDDRGLSLSLSLSFYIPPLFSRVSQFFQLRIRRRPCLVLPGPGPILLFLRLR